jgi:hypothetical protein
MPCEHRQISNAESNCRIMLIMYVTVSTSFPSQEKSSSTSALSRVTLA